MTNSSPETSGPCAICNGGYEEHFDKDGKRITQHLYTTTPGDLTTPEERAKAQPATRPMVVGPQVMGGASPGRIVEVLMERGLIGVEEALYIGNMGPKPQISHYEAPSGFADPAMGVKS